MHAPELTIVENIGELLTMEPSDGDPLGRIVEAAVLVERGRVAWAGRAEDLPMHISGSRAVAADVVRVDAGGRLVTPGLVEPHAHPIFAGSRAAEFDLRARGRS